MLNNWKKTTTMTLKKHWNIGILVVVEHEFETCEGNQGNQGSRSNMVQAWEWKQTDGQIEITDRFKSLVYGDISVQKNFENQANFKKKCRYMNISRFTVPFRLEMSKTCTRCRLDDHEFFTCSACCSCIGSKWLFKNYNTKTIQQQW